MASGDGGSDFALTTKKSKPGSQAPHRGADFCNEQVEDDGDP
jgi:hypothetical protein